MPAPTVKFTVAVEAAVVEEPEAPMLCEPPAAAGTVKVAVQAPVALAVVGEPCGAPSKVTMTLVSLAAKPDPVTFTDVPAGPLFLLIEIPAPTLNVNGAIDEVEDPETPMLWAPPWVAGTGNVAVQVPFEPAVVGEPIGVLSKLNWILVSLEPKPDPVAVTEVPAGPLFLLKAKLGSMLKLWAGTDSVVAPKEVTEWEVPEVTEGTTKVVVQVPVAPALVDCPIATPSKFTVIPCSFMPKPLPVTVIEAPTVPFGRLKLMVGLEMTVTLEVAEPPLPEAVIVWAPAAAFAVTGPHDPVMPACTAEPTATLSIWIVTISPFAKPEPFKISVLPVDWVAVILGTIVKLAAPDVPEVVPTATTAWGPAMALGTTKVVLQVPPPATVVEPTGPESKFILILSLAVPVPETITVIPGPPAAGLRFGTLTARAGTAAARHIIIPRTRKTAPYLKNLRMVIYCPPFYV
jgi:hypothetical protein